jgi:hypothetical protein
MGFWLRGVDLNHRPLGYEPNELPDCSTPRNDHSNGTMKRQTAAVLWFSSQKCTDANRIGVLDSLDSPALLPHAVNHHIDPECQD